MSMPKETADGPVKVRARGWCCLVRFAALAGTAAGVSLLSIPAAQADSAAVKLGPGEWRGQHLSCGSLEGADTLVELIDEFLGPMGINVLVVEVNYNFKFESHPEISQGSLDKEAARRIAAACRKHGIRVIPLLNCLGHQSWSKTTFTLLKEHPEFDETPELPLDNPDIYCRSWCPLHPGINALAFDLMDELLDAFQADALHVGMDEVFLIASDQCPRCKGKDPAELFAKATNDYHEHLVGKRGAEMLMWGDRFIDSEEISYGTWEAAANGTAPSVEMVPEDIIMCDWHYGPREEYESIPFFQEKGFRVLSSPWRNVKAAEAFIEYSLEEADGKFLGVLFTGWSCGSGGSGLLEALRGHAEEDAGGYGEAAVLRRGLEILQQE